MPARRERTAKMHCFAVSNLSLRGRQDYVGPIMGFGGAMRIRFDRGPHGVAAWFSRPRRLIRADSAAEVPDALGEMDMARASGHWLAGYASYELGYVIEPRLQALMPGNRRLPLIAFGVYDGPLMAEPLSPGPAELGPFTPGWTADDYANAFQKAHDFIGAGDIYQTNLTFPLGASFAGEPLALYAGLSKGQPVGHGSIIIQDGLPAIL